MRIVHIVPHRFLPADEGGRIKTSALASALAACGELHVVDLDKRAVGEKGAHPVTPLPSGGAAEIHSVMAGSGVLLRRWRHARHWMAARVIAGLRPDVVVSDDITCAALAVHSPGAQRIVHTHNIESELHLELAARGGGRRLLRKANRYARVERELLPLADQVWGVRESDTGYYQRVGCSAAAVVPNTVPASAFDEAPKVGERGRALYFGSLWWGPNADAARCLAEISSRLSAQGKQHHFVIAGRGAHGGLVAALEGVPGIELAGFVPSLKEEARRAAAIVIPLEWGGGTKIKTMEALALGKPVLTTPEGARGLDIVDGEHALVRDLGESFDRALVEIMEAPEQFQDMALRGQQHVRQRYSQEALNHIVAELLTRER